MDPLTISSEETSAHQPLKIARNPLTDYLQQELFTSHLHQYLDYLVFPIQTYPLQNNISWEEK